MKNIFLSLFLIFSVLLPSSSQAGSPINPPGTGMDGIQAWPKIALVQVVGGLASPLHITHAGDGSGRLFVVERGGGIKIIQAGVISGTFLDIHERVLSPANGGGSEEGLLSIAFPSGFGGNLKHFYVYYTNQNGDNQISRFSVGANLNQADPASEEILLVIPHPTYSNHNGGQLAFGKDGMLYAGIGDGGGGGDPLGNAQDPGSLLGKILRIDVEPAKPSQTDQLSFLPRIARQDTSGGRTPPPVRRYAIPGDNPFIFNPVFLPEIWALGLRNPWRFSFDRLLGDLWIGDVGQGKREEIDLQAVNSPGGENYGWNILEGEVCYSDPNCNPAGFTPPLFVYPHTEGNCSVTGGMVYRGADQIDLKGIYFFADYCTGRIWGLRSGSNGWETSLLLDSPYNISSFGENEAGELFVADLSSGTIYQVVQIP